jgi:hypothetical protein
MVTEASSTRRRRSPLAAALAALCTIGMLVVAGPAFAGPLVVEPEAPTADWYLYHHWTGPGPQGWPPPAGPGGPIRSAQPGASGAPGATTRPGRSAQPLPPVTVTSSPVVPTPPTGGSPDPDPSTPPATAGPESTDPRAEPTRTPRSPRPIRSTAPAAPDQGDPIDGQAADDRVEAGTQPGPGVSFDPMAAGPQGLGLMEAPQPTETPDPRGLDERFPDPVPTASPALATRLSSTDARLEAAERGRSLVYSGSIGLAIALIGLGMMARRRRTW